eukprot:2425715-Amphidinium_carterae.1
MQVTKTTPSQVMAGASAVKSDGHMLHHDTSNSWSQLHLRIYIVRFRKWSPPGARALLSLVFDATRVSGRDLLSIG